MCTKSSQGKPASWLVSVATGALLVLLAPVAIAQEPDYPAFDPNFEIDTTDTTPTIPEANALDEAWPGDDWETVYVCGPGVGHDDDACDALGGLNDNLINTTGILHDHNQMTIFWKGGSKDPRDVTDWEWKNGSVPDKDEISHAGAAAYKGTSDDLVMYIFADRFSNDGDSLLGAWFFQDTVNTVEDPNHPGQGTFSGRHKNGDILWIGEFSGGGVVASLQVLKWNDPNPPAGDTAFDTACTDSNPALPNQVKGTNLCVIAEGSGSGGGGNGYLASVTTDAQSETERASPWDYTPKQGAPNVFPYNSFMEGGINITQLLGETPCFSSFLIESRSSTSVTAQLKDFVLGQVDTCKIEVRKTCESSLAADKASLDHTFKVYVKNVGYANLDSVDLHDDHYDAQDHKWTWTGTLGPDAEEKVGEYTVNNTTQQISNTVYAVGKTSGGYETAEATDTVTCPPVPVNPGLTVSKECDKTSLVVDTNSDPDRLWVQVSYKGTVCNTGDVRLTGLTVWDTRDSQEYPITPSQTTLNPGDCASYSASYYPSAAVGDGVTTQYNVGNACFAAGSSTQQWVDEVDAQASSVLAGTVDAVASVQKTCPLCPEASCPAPAQ